MNKENKQPPELPTYLRNISKVVVDREAVNTPLAERVRHRLPQLGWEVIEGGAPTMCSAGQTVLYLKHYRGRFLKSCPGTSRYRCCGYRIVHIGENCPMSCSYCILQAYFQDRVLKVWANQHDLFMELAQAFGKDPKQRFRVGTGEFTDSLALEPVTGYSRDLVAFLADYPNVCLELKSKTTDLSWMEAVERPDRILPAWSLNAPQIHDKEEQDTASLEERLKAARTCAANGFRVCLHFDPVIDFTGWEQGYGHVTDMIFDYLRPGQIAYLSMGSFRCMPRLKEVIARNHPNSTYIYNEFVTGLDGKMRLLRPLRVRQLKYLVERLRRHGLDRQLYLCMESDQVWQAVLGTTPKAFGGLSRRLLDQAFGS